MTLRRACLAGAAALVLAGPAQPQSLTLAGSIGQNKALLVIDGQPHTLAVGQTAMGVTLVQLADGQAQVRRDGQTLTLRLGAPVRLGGAAAPAVAQAIVITAGPGGHFTANGAINGRPVQFMVDTGATNVALSEGEAERLGIDLKGAQRGMTQTANGPVPVHLVSLSAVRVGEVEVNNVAAVVLPAQMPFVLLGNSFLSRFQMRRDNDVMRLERRP